MKTPASTASAAAEGGECRSDGDGEGARGTEAGDADYADATGTAAERVTAERLHIAATAHPRGSLDGALPSPPVGLENLPTGRPLCQCWGLGMLMLWERWLPPLGPA